MKAWKLKDPITRRMFEERVSDRIEGANVGHASFSNALFNSAREVCGETTGRRQRDRETWWWNEEIQLTVREKKLAFKRWKSGGTKEAHKQYREKNKQAKRMVAIARDKAWKHWNDLFSQTKEEQRCSK